MTGRVGARAAVGTAAAVTSGVIFYWLGYRVLDAVHPAEDAYILFRYADHLAAGHGIVFNIGGPHAEGATDFLWLLLLAVGVWLGGDVALTALALNALGAALAAFVLARVCWGDQDRPPGIRALLGGVLPSALLAGGALAGYGGFSSMLYSALILWLFATTVAARGRHVLLIPWLGLTVALFRPDGVIVGIPFAALGLWRAWSEQVLRQYIGMSAASAVLGLAYAIWRWQYFGLPLPLPLYVKQNGPGGSGWSALFPGLRSNWEWFADSMGPHLIVAGLLAVLLYLRFWRVAALWRLLVFMLPVGLLLTALIFVVQTQNVEFRFQAPAHLMLVYALVYAAGRVIDEARTPAARWIAAGLVLAAVTPANVAGLRALELHLGGAWRTYVEAFAPRFGPAAGSKTIIALTEAGAVPYWTDAQVADIVGLNYPPAALRPPTIADVRALDPDVVFLHQGTSLANNVLIPPEERGGRIHRIAPGRLGAALRPSRRAVLERRVSSYAEIGLLNVQYAATVLIGYLSETDRYDIFVVDPSGHRTYLHVWGLKKDWPLREKTLRALEWSLEPGNYASYLEVRRGRGGQRRVTGEAS